MNSCFDKEELSDHIKRLQHEIDNYDGDPDVSFLGLTSKYGYSLDHLQVFMEDLKAQLSSLQ